MGMFSFIKEAGEKLFKKDEVVAAEQVAKADPSPVNVDAVNKAAADAITDYIKVFDFDVDNLAVSFDGDTSVATVSGSASTFEVKEKVLLCCGNVAGVGSVVDKLGVIEPAVRPVFHTVVSNMNNVAWGIIGVGDVCEVKSAPAMQLIKDSHIAAVMRRDKSKAQDYAKRHNISQWYDDADAS